MKRPGESKETIPNAADFSAGAVERAVLKHAVMHPLTKLPFAFCVVAVAYLAAVDMSSAAFAAAFLSGAASAISVAWQYFVHGEAHAAAYVAKLREWRRESVRHRCDELRQSCIQFRFSAGAKKLADLFSVYMRLVQFIDERDTRDGAEHLERFRALADDAYQQGLKNLSVALDIFRVLQRFDCSKLEREKETWQKETQTSTDSAEKQVLARKIAAHEKRIRLFTERQELLSELLVKCEELEGALDGAYLQLSADASELALDGLQISQTELERQLDAARKVEERLRNLGTHEHEDDHLYEDYAEKDDKN